MELEKKQAEQNQRQMKSKSVLGFFQNNILNEDNEEGSLELSFAGLFKCMFCTHQKPVDDKQQLLRIAASLDKIEK